MGVTPSGHTKVAWVTAESHAEELRSSLADANTQVTQPEPWVPPAELLDEYGDDQFEPMVVIGAVVAAGWLVKRMSDVLLDWKRPGGLVVDSRDPQDLVVREVSTAPRGTVITVERDGTRVVFKPQQQDEALTALTEIIRGASGI